MGSVLEHPSMVVSFSVGLRKTYGAALMRLHSAFGFDRYAVGDFGAAMICPLLSGPKSVLDLATKEEWNGAETQAGGDYRQAA